MQKLTQRLTIAVFALVLLGFMVLHLLLPDGTISRAERRKLQQFPVVSGEALLSAVQPQAAAISCGLDNDYGHPHQETLARLQAAGAKIYRTDTMGTITFTYENGALQASAAGGPQQAAA